MHSKSATTLARRGMSLFVAVWLASPAVAQADRADTAPAAVAAAPVAAEPEPRELLVLTDACVDGHADEAGSQAHALFQMPWNHLGMTMRVRYLTAGPPDDVDPAVTRAVVLHLVGETAAPAWLWPWLRTQRAKQRLRFVHLGSLLPLAAADERELVLWLADFGMVWVRGSIDSPLRCVFEPRSQPLCAFEAMPAERRVLGPRNLDPDNEVWVTVRDRRDPADARMPVVVGRRFALALDPFVVTAGTGVGDRRWHLDPFRFFAAALGLDGVPMPDPNVAWGRRKFVLHIDGDGFENVATTAPERTAAQVFVDRIVDAKHIPMTLSVIVRSVTDDLAVATPTPAMRLAQHMFATPWVESASHTVLHPLDWRATWTPRSVPRAVVWYDPRSLAQYAHDMRAEVVESVRFVDRHLAPADRPCRLLLWSGACNPTADVVRACDEVQCLNLNGGGFRCDASQPTIGHVSPWGLQQEDTFQVYCGAANENVFDGFYTTMPTAFRHIDETIARTGAPRVLKPANVYAHFYSSEQEERLRVLEELVDEWAFRRPTVPVYASEYAASVVAAQRHCRVARTRRGFAFADFGACGTVRIDGPARPIDWAASTGVLGANRIGDATYVQLGADAAELVFAAQESALPHLEQADHTLRDCARDATGLRFLSAAFRDRHVVIAGLPAGRTAIYRVDGQDHTGLVDADGRLEIALPGAGSARVEVPTP